jgi:hypothetical protein
VIDRNENKEETHPYKKLREIEERKDWVREREGEERWGKRVEMFKFWLVRIQKLDYRSVRSSKPNLAISYKMNSNWGWNHEINIRVYGIILGKM